MDAAVKAAAELVVLVDMVSAAAKAEATRIAVVGAAMAAAAVATAAAAATRATDLMELGALSVGSAAAVAAVATTTEVAKDGAASEEAVEENADLWADKGPGEGGGGRGACCFRTRDRTGSVRRPRMPPLIPPRFGRIPIAPLWPLRRMLLRPPRRG